MGFDLKAYLEYTQSEQYELFANIRIPRNYGLFAALTGGRVEPDAPTQSKGLPAALSFHTLYAEEGSLIEIDDGKYSEWGGDIYCRHQDIERLISSRRFKQLDELHLGGDIMAPNWLTSQETEQTYAAYLAAQEPTSKVMQATIEAMRWLPNARLVVWLTP